MDQPSTADAGRLSYAIFTLARAHRGFAAALLRDLDLHPGQELLLMRLLDRDGQTQSELLGRVGLDHSTVSKSLRRMQEAGLLTREPSERDRRVLHVWLTDKGRAMREPLTDLWATLERACTAGLTAAEIDAFTRLAGAVEHAIARRASAEETS
ncbi:DNA-binding MarR family transcriptional regulator [Saccharothrix saharensis]|uniref:DNA-binding MarR family transcriptional regulator n=1 Tax=Saccharothrix saharensis TaxID=571190 RepID=A0A543J850_9PSEU|nr:MarR family winged helix-turn-helix transcriptional regulator [Saccharothrix saharensis]TQM78991.1 DNA-binding MarR family transcriptional regulator [Saccharothrix saharensis]